MSENTPAQTAVLTTGPVKIGDAEIPIMPQEIYVVSYSIVFTGGHTTYGAYSSWCKTRADAEQFITQHCRPAWAKWADDEGTPMITQRYAITEYAMPPM